MVRNRGFRSVPNGSTRRVLELCRSSCASTIPFFWLLNYLVPPSTALALHDNCLISTRKCPAVLYSYKAAYCSSGTITGTRVLCRRGQGASKARLPLYLIWAPVLSLLFASSILGNDSNGMASVLRVKKAVDAFSGFGVVGLIFFCSPGGCHPYRFWKGCQCWGFSKTFSFSKTQFPTLLLLAMNFTSLS